MGFSYRPCPRSFAPKVIALWLVLHRPQEAQEIPTERPVMRLVFIKSAPLEVVPHSRVDVAMGWDSFFPIPLTVLGTPGLKVLGDFKEHCLYAPIVVLAEHIERVVDVLPATPVMRRGHEKLNTIQRREALVDLARNEPQIVRYHVQREEVTASLALSDVPYSAGRKLSAIPAIFDFRKAIPPLQSNKVCRR